MPLRLNYAANADDLRGQDCYRCVASKNDRVSWLNILRPVPLDYSEAHLDLRKTLPPAVTEIPNARDPNSPLDRHENEPEAS